MRLSLRPGKIRKGMAAERLEASESQQAIFFEAVRVSAENRKIRKNRLRPLSKIRKARERVPDLSHIVEGVWFCRWCRWA